MRTTRMILFRNWCILLLAWCSLTAHSQDKDSLMHVLSLTKNPYDRLHLMYYILDDPGDGQLQKTLYYHKKLLVLTRSQGDKAGEAVVTGILGYSLSLTGNVTTGTELLFKALKLAEESRSQQALGMIYSGLGYVYNDLARRKTYHQKALAASTAAKDYLFMCYALSNLSYHYLTRNQLDSALYFSQRHLQLATAQKVEQVIPYAMMEAGDINYQMGQKGLALEYYRAALNDPFIAKKAKANDKGAVFAALTRFYLAEGRKDSALHYAQLHYGAVKHAHFAYQIRAAFNLWKAYEKTDSDSALKYATRYYAMKDSMYSIGKVQQMQALSLLEEDRQQKMDEERKHNLQYAAIAFGVVGLLIGFLVLSHTVLANQKLIRFLGMVSLLILFEFLNLLLHPWLGTITHHSPVFMLLALVCVAALLVPLHHKLEHRIIQRLVEKNNRIRLDAAKRTIQELEGETETVIVDQRSGAEKKGA